ncbi:transporter substrate-binding domain-containing protein [Wukongibacter baidiensis]|uniref:transporter substrate-binding domain-containing protein n=1 Tax=Wukongibacter baidiensis TaxID=1723361 RepID=UPI003D7F5456
MSKEKLLFILKRFLLLSLAVLAISGLMKLFGIDLEEMEKREAQKVIIVGTTGNYYPYSFLDKNGELSGFDIDILEEVGKRTNIEVKFVINSYNELIDLLDKGEIDTIANGVRINKKKIKKYYFSNPYGLSGAQLVIRENDSSIIDLNTLKGKRAGVVFKSDYEDFLRDYDKEYEIDIRVYDTHEETLKAVVSSEIDAALDDSVTILEAIKDMDTGLKLVGELVNVTEKGFPFLKNMKGESLLKDINEALGTMEEDGTLSTIYETWF